MLFEYSEEHELLQALALDVDGTFPHLVAAYESQLRRFIMSPGSDPDAAQDILQDCWLRVYRALQRYSAERIRSLELQAWLFTIVLNRTRTFFRKQHPMSIISTEDLGDTVECPDLSPEDMFEIKQQVELAVEAVKQLPPTTRAVLTLYYLKELSYQEIATQLGLTVGNVRTHAFRGLRALRKRLITTNIT